MKRYMNTHVLLFTTISKIIFWTNARKIFRWQSIIPRYTLTIILTWFIFTNRWKKTSTTRFVKRTKTYRSIINDAHTNRWWWTITLLFFNTTMNTWPTIKTMTKIFSSIDVLTTVSVIPTSEWTLSDKIGWMWWNKSYVHLFDSQEEKLIELVLSNCYNRIHGFYRKHQYE